MKLMEGNLKDWFPFNLEVLEFKFKLNQLGEEAVDNVDSDLTLTIQYENKEVEVTVETAKSVHSAMKKIGEIMVHIN
jgi:hypothetical protein